MTQPLSLVKRVTLDIPDFSSRNEANPFGIDKSSPENEDEEVSSANHDTMAVEAMDDLEESESSHNNLPLQPQRLNPHLFQNTLPHRAEADRLICYLQTSGD